MRKKIFYVGDLSVIEKNDFYLAMKLKIKQKETDSDPKNEIYLRLMIEEALSVLTGRQKECVELSFKGYNQEEIAEYIGISQPTVAQHLNAAFKKIRDYLGQ